MEIPLNLKTTGGIIVVGAGIALIFLLKAGLQSVATSIEQGLGEVVDIVNPVNIAQNGAHALDSLYKAQGENNTTFGNDTRTLWDIPRNLTNAQIDKLPMGASASRDLYQWLTGSTGNQVSDFNEWWDGVFK